jgi:hypothetical protein
MSWPTHSYFEEEEDPPKSKAMLTDRKYTADWPSRAFEYEFQLGERRESWTLSYEVGVRAYIWAVRENRDHVWDFIVSWNTGGDK